MPDFNSLAVLNPVSWDAPENANRIWRTGQSVWDRGGLWQAVNKNQNSQPVSGNADWELVGGLPYVDVTLDSTGLENLGHMLAPTLVVPDPAVATDVVGYRGAAISYIPGTMPYNLEMDLYVFYNDHASISNDVFLSTSFEGPDTTSLTPKSALVGTAIENGGGTNVVAGKGLVILNNVGGSAVTLLGLNQGTHTFTVQGDQTQPMSNGGYLYINGSTGNDGTYTVISATFVTDHTDLVVAENIPNPTADGNASVSGAIPILSGDGIVKIRIFYSIDSLP